MRFEVSDRTLTLTGAAAAGGLLLLCAWTQSHPAAESATWVFLRLLPALIASCFLPGSLLLWIGGEKLGEKNLDLFEWIVFSFGLGLVLISALYLLTLSVHGSSVFAVAVLNATVVSLVLAIVWRRRKNDGVYGIGWSSKYLPTLLIGFLLVVMGFLLYWIGGIAGGIPDREEGLDILIIRKLLSNPEIASTNLFYKPGEALNGFRPSYQFLLALVGRLSGLDPIVVFIRLRFVWGILVLLSLYTLVRQIWGSRSLAQFSTFALVAMVFSGRAGNLEDLSGLIPLSRQDDVSVGLLVPVGLAFAVRLIRPRECPVLYWLVSPLVLAVIAVADPARGIQLLFYLLVLVVGGLLIARKRRLFFKTFYLCMVVVILMQLDRAIQGVPDTREKEVRTSELESAREALGRCCQEPSSCLLQSPQDYFGEGSSIFGGFCIFAIAAAPFLVALGGIGGTWLGLTVLTLLGLMSVPLLYWFFFAATYSTDPFSPAAYLLHPSFLILGLLLYSLAVSADRATRVFDRWMGRVQIKAWVDDLEREEPDHVFSLPGGLARFVTLVGMAGGLVLILMEAPTLRLVIFSHFEEYVLIVLALTVFAVVYRWSGGEQAGQWLQRVIHHRFRSPKVVWGATAVVCGALLVVHEPPDSELDPNGETLISRYRQSRQRPDVSDLPNWFRATRYIGIPDPMIHFIHSLPPGKVFAQFPDRIHRLPVVTNHYVFTYGTFLASEIDFVELYGQLRGIPMPSPGQASSRIAEMRQFYQEQILERFPFYDDEEPAELTREWIETLGVNYIIWQKRGRGAALRGRDLSRRFPKHFKKAFETRRFVLYRVKP